MKIINKALPYVVCCLIFGLLGCGGSSSNTVTEPLPVLPPDAAPDPVPIEKTPDDSPPISPLVVISNAQSFLDDDEDGIENSQDPWPNLAPVLAPLSDALPDTDFLISSLRNNNSVVLLDTVIAGESLSIDLTKVSQNGENLWLLWQGEGLNWAQPIDATNEVLSVIPPELSLHQISLVQGNQIIAKRVVNYFGADEAIIYPITEPLVAGTGVTIYGENLVNLKGLNLGSENLALTVLGDGAMHIDLPSLPESRRLQTISTNAEPRTYPLPLYRTLTLKPENDLNAQGWSMVNEQGELFLSDSPTISILAGEAVALHFSHTNRSSSISTVTWPDESVLYVGAQSTLQKWTYNVLHSVGLSTQNWHEDRSRLPLLSSLQDLALLLTNELNTQSEQGNSQGIHVSSRALWLKYLDAGLTWQLSTGSTKTNFFFAGTAPLYEQIFIVSNQKSVPGRATYNSMTMATDAFTSLFENGCLGLESITKPSNVWPSDLCLRNASAVYLSIGASDTNKQSLRSHVKSYADKDMIGPSWGGLLNLAKVGFITTDSGAPLCRMERCSVEVITGGFGYLSSSNLSTLEAKAYQHVLMRTFVEKVLLELAATIIGGGTDKDSAAACVVNRMLTATVKGVPMATAFVEFQNKVDSASSQSDVLKIMFETVVSFAADYLINVAQSSDPKTLSCFASNAAKAAAKQKFKDSVAGALSKNVPYKIAEAVNSAIDKWQVITTPRKIVFDVYPKTEVLNIYTRNTDQILVDDTSGSLVIEGCYITNQKIDSSGNPDPQYNYWPEVHLRSSSGQRVSFTTNQSHYENMSDRCQSRLVVPASELVTTMRGMKSGRISLDLKLTHDNDEFAGFPSNELPVPGGSFTYVGEASLSHVEGSYLKVGSRNIVKGQNLSIFNKNALTSYVTSSINDTNVTEFTSLTYIDDETIAIDIPQSALLVGSFVLSLHTLDASGTSFSLAVPGPINVAPPTLSTIQLSDRGAKADDNMYVEVLDANSEPIIISADNYLKLQLPAGNSSATLIFDSSNLQILDFDTSQAVSATWPIKFVVVCVDGGKEETCTWDLRGAVKSRNGGQTYTIQEKGKLKNNRDITVTLP